MLIGETYDQQYKFWSLGVLIVELFTGRHPYGDSNDAKYKDRMQLQHQHQQQFM